MDYFDFDSASSAPAAEEQLRFHTSPTAPSTHVCTEDEGPLEPAPWRHSESVQTTSGGSAAAPNVAGFDDFSSWIPHMSRPSTPCQYCRSRGLHCLVMYQEGQTACSCCIALSRDCSFSRVPEPSGPGRMEEFAVPGARSRSSSRTRPPSVHDDACEGSLSMNGQGRKTRTRFSYEAVRMLKDWLAQHAAHPYPTDAEKDQLKRRTGLKRSQISNWLANARRRGKVPSSSSNRAVSPGLASRPRGRAPSPAVVMRSSQPMDIVVKNPAMSVNDLDPLERWQRSPPEHEPASVSDIAHAVAVSTLPASKDTSSGYSSRVDCRLESSASSSISARGAPSMNSSAESLRSSGSEFSFGSAFSHQSQQSFGSMEALRRKDRRRRRRSAINRIGSMAAGVETVSESRPFQCTFCIDTFKTKYDWQRHEKSLHLSLDKWTCAPRGGVREAEGGRPTCVYCDAIETSPDHLETHHHEQCQARTVEERTFYRKDHLQQHLRLVHGCEMGVKSTEWKSSIDRLRSRCGFCGHECEDWQGRVDHLAGHYRAGASMANWKGDWGFDQEILDLIENAVPPWLVDHERRTPNPFSASQYAEHHSFSRQRIDHRGRQSSLNMADHNTTTTATMDGSNQHQHHNQDQQGQYLTIEDMEADAYCHGLMEGNMCYERLERVLGVWVQRQQAQGVRPTNEHLQAEARKIVYMSPDPWNQTAADNPMWLNRFKRRYGLSPVREVSREEENDGHGVVDTSFETGQPECKMNSDLSIDRGLSMFRLA